MSTQFVTTIATGEEGYEVGKQAALQAKDTFNEENKPDIAVLFSSSKYEYAAVARGIKNVMGEIPIIGCTTAGQFIQGKTEKEGLACAFISSTTHRFFTGIGTNLKSNPIQTIENAVQNMPREVEDYPYHAAMLFVDGLAGKGEETVLAASSILGPMVKFAGAAAADSLAFQTTNVFSDDQAMENAASICLVASSRPIIISVKHGHKPISPPLRVTRAEGNILYEIEDKPALEVWKEYVRKPLQAKGVDIDTISPLDLSKFLVEYEAGLLIGPEYKIRFPLSCNADGSLNFVCSILEGSVIKIMDSTQKDQIEAARQAAKMAIQASRGVKLAGAIVFDCVCRAMILQEHFSEAIAAKKEVFGEVPFVGGETYGEIAMEMGQLSGFHNTTTVIMLFPA